MTQRRLSTVFDYSNLRLHPDGTRVYQKADNVRPHLVKKTSEGPRGSWIARDAGGSGRVSRYRKPVKDASKEESGEEIDLDGDGVGKSGGTKPEEGEEGEEGEDEEEEGSEDEGDGRKRKLPQYTKRKLKRQKFSTDFDYLQEHLPFPEFQHSTDAESVGVAQQGLSEPSTDLLKSIHRFAAEFYTERGQLLNISREYRKERKMRRLQKLGKGKGKQVRRTKSRQSGASSGPSSSNVSEEENGEGLSEKLSEEENDDDDDEPIEIEEEDDQDGDEEVSDQEYEASEGDDVDEEDKLTKKRSPRKGKGKPTRKRSQKLYTDMYKMFDGSAILAIGMLVQEMISHMVDTEISADWTEEMEQAYGSRVSHDDEDGEENPSPENANKDRRTDEEDGVEQDEDNAEGEDENEEDDQDGDEDEGIAGKRGGSPPLTTGDLSSHSDVDMKTESDTFDPDDEESHDESDSD